MPRLPQPGDNTDDFAKFTFELWEGLNGKYSFYVKRWRRTLEFLRDQHWQTLKELDREVIADWRRFPLQNYTLAYYNDFLTDYLKSEVRFSGVPNSSDPHDIDAAELSEQLLKDLWDRLDFDKVRVDLGAWIMACGTGALRVFWDTDTGNPVPLGLPQEDGSIVAIDPETLEPLPEGTEPVMVDRGEIGVEVISPQFVRWASNPAHGVMLGLLLSFEEAKTFYGEDVADRLTYSDSHEGMAASLNKIEQPGITPTVDQRTLVIEHYIPSSAENPGGLWWTSAQQGKMMIHPAWPLPAGRIPVIGFRWIPLPGEDYIGVSPLYGITFENKIYEEITARILEWYQKAKPKRLLKSGGGITHGDITDEPFQELIVNQGAEPDMLEIQDAPQGLFRILQIAQNDMMMSSGRAFEEGDEIPEGVATQRIRTPGELKGSKSVTSAHIASKSSWKNVGEILLHYAGNFYNENRIVAIQGPDKGFMWREFAGENLMTKDGLAATLHVDEIPLFPQSRQNLRDSVIGLLQSPAGQILFAGPDGQLDMDRIKGALQATGLDANMDIVDPDVLEARNEQNDFKNLQEGQDPPTLQSWQNNTTHWIEHTNILKSIRFKAWSPQAQKAFLEHVSETEEALNEAAEGEAQAMVEQEKELRRVREQEELRADVMKEWAKSLIELVKETTGVEVNDILGAVGGSDSKED